jgi:TPR repeat protein
MYFFNKIFRCRYLLVTLLTVACNLQAMSVGSTTTISAGSAASSFSSLSSTAAPVAGQSDDGKKSLQVVVRSRIQPNEFKSSSVKDANDYERGVRYFQGTGVAKDVKAAIASWTAGAANGCPRSQYCLADCYESGCGVFRDEVDALWYYLKAAKQGLVPAAKKYHLFGTDMIEYYSEATLNGDLKPLCKLKDCYLAGMADTNNGELRLFETKDAVYAWYVEQLTNLGNCWLFGDHGMVKNEKLAVECLNRAVDEGRKNALLCYDHALVLLGYCRLYGLGLEKDAKEAITLFEEAIRVCGSVEGTTQLGYVLRRGVV